MALQTLSQPTVAVDPVIKAKKEDAFAHAPRVRVEWLIAGTRVLLAGGGLLALALEPQSLQAQAFALYLLSWYLAYSLGMLALVWAPVRFAVGWSIAVHLFDLVAFSLLVATTQGAGSPVFLGFLFLVVCGTLRWQLKGTFWTAAASVSVYAAISLIGTYVVGVRGFGLGTFLIHSTYLGIVTAMFAALSSHQRRFQFEIGQIASWPKQVSRDPHQAAAELLPVVRRLLDAPMIVLVWESGRDDLTIAWLGQEGEAHWIEGSREELHPMVLPGLTGRSFQASDAALEHGTVVVHSPRGFTRRDCRPINEALRARFGMHAVQSWPVEGELVSGRIFCVNKTKMGIDDLVVGELVASQAASRLDNALMLGHLQDAAKLDERVRLAGDLHDSLLQAQAGAALQLLAARRMLDQRPERARRGLEEVQNLLERGELEMRSFIRGLRPTVGFRPPVASPNLADRLEALRQRVRQQWSVAIDLRPNGALERVPMALRHDVYHLIQEAVINAAKHAQATTITVELSMDESEIRIDVSDNGRGFPFRGTFDLQSLDAMKVGPLTLKERVARMTGCLTLTSADTGSTVGMRVPLLQVSD